MKILISILLISSIGFVANNQFLKDDLQETCSCVSDHCSCTASCGSTTASCSCGVTCNCGCDFQEEPTNGGGYRILPTANGVQNENSIKSQAYFVNSNIEGGVTIGGYFETLRNAIANEDLETYAENAPLLEDAFKNLSQSEQTAYWNWAKENLTHVTGE